MTFDKMGYAGVIVTLAQEAKRCIEKGNPYKAYSYLDTLEEDARDLCLALRREAEGDKNE